jgi:hypothetical protein
MTEAGPEHVQELEEPKVVIDTDESNSSGDSPKPVDGAEASPEGDTAKPASTESEPQQDTNEEEEEGEEGSTKPKRRQKEASPSPPPRKKVPTRAPPPPPPKSYDVPADTWSTKPVSNRVWEVDEEEVVYEEQDDQLDLSGTELVEQYDLQGDLGRGFFAVVKRAVHKQTGEKVAVKVGWFLFM